MGADSRLPSHKPIGIGQLCNLRGRVAVVTGACGSLGQVICSGLAELGCNLALVDRNHDALDRQAVELKTNYGVRVTTIDADLEIDEERKKVQSSVCSEFSNIDVLVNNAAFVGDSSLTGWVAPLEEQTIETWRRALEVNLTACFHLSQLFSPALRSSTSGAIINVGSIYGVVGPDMSLYEGTPMGNPAGYAASKGGLVQLTRWLSSVLAPNIRVNAMSPGGIYRGQPGKFVDRYEARTPMRRMANESDMFGAIAFLASDMSLYVTGQNIVVDGGWTAW